MHLPSLTIFPARVIPQHGTLPPDVALGGSKTLSGEGAWGMEGFTGTLTSLLEHLSGLDISMDLIMDYGGASGKVSTPCSPCSIQI